MVGDEIGQVYRALECQAKEIRQFLASNTELWVFLHGWHREEVTNNGPSEGTSADRMHPCGPLLLVPMPALRV